MSGPTSPAVTFPAVVEARDAMATRFEVVLPGRDRPHLLGAAEEALDEVERLEAQLSLYRDRSELTYINAHASEGPVKVEPQLFSLLFLADLVHRLTDGAFDPSVTPLLRAWGFIGGSGRPADARALAEARAATGWEHVEVDRKADTVRFSRPGVMLDLGAIGKGYALDRAGEALAAAGVEAGLLHAGTSSVIALGAPPEASAWRIALRDPAAEAGTPLGWVELCDRALSVSAPHGKAFRHGDRLYGHVLDPRTGDPARAALLAAVSHTSAALTDALSTALLVLGVPGLPLLAERFPEADFLVVPSEAPGLPPHTAGPNLWRFHASP